MPPKRKSIRGSPRRVSTRIKKSPKHDTEQSPTKPRKAGKQKARTPTKASAEREKDEVVVEAEEIEEYDDSDDASIQEAEGRLDMNPGAKMAHKELHEKRIQVEKDLIMTRQRKGKKIRSPLFLHDYFREVSIPENWEELAEKRGLQWTEGLKKIKDNTYPAVCMLCLTCPSKPLKDCVFSSCHYNPTNLMKHMDRNHQPEEAPECYPAGVAATSATKTTATPSDEKKVSMQTGIQAYTKTVDPVAALQGLRTMTYRFINGTNSAIRTGTNEALIELLQYAVDNAEALRKTPNQLGLHPEKYRAIQIHESADMISAVTDIISYSRTLYQRWTGSNIPFCCIAHDLWSAKNHEVLGCSLQMIIPNIFIQVELPIVLKRVTAKKAVETAAVILGCVGRYGINQEDILRGVNDTTGSAVSTGRILCNNRGPQITRTCWMHVVELVIKHATGIVKRTKNKKIVDEFPAAEEIRTLVVGFVRYVWDKNARHRLKDYSEHCRGMFGYEPFKLDVPNKTRVGGVYKMYYNFLRQKAVISTYASQDLPVKKYRLTREHWTVLAEITAILEPLHNLAMDVQKSTAGHIAFAWYAAALCRHQIMNSATYTVFDISKTWGPKTDPKEIPTAKVSRDKLTPVATDLINRIGKEFDRYISDPDDDILCAMFCHPVACAFGFLYVQKLAVSDAEKNSYSRARSIMETYLFHTFRDKFLMDNIKIKKETDPDTDSDEGDKKPAAVNTTDLDVDNSDEEAEFLMALGGDKGKDGENEEQDEEKLKNLLMIQLEQEIKAELDTYRNYVLKVDWLELLDHYPTKEYIDQRKKHTFKPKNVKNAKSPRYTEQMFDVLGWWRGFGMTHYPKLGMAASIFLGKPCSNAFQERVFSRGTFTDHALRRRLDGRRFEMSVLQALANKKIAKIREDLGPAQIKDEKSLVRAFLHTDIDKKGVHAYWTTLEEFKATPDAELDRLDRQDKKQTNSDTESEEEKEEGMGQSDDDISISSIDDSVFGGSTASANS